MRRPPCFPLTNCSSSGVSLTAGSGTDDPLAQKQASDSPASNPEQHGPSRPLLSTHFYRLISINKSVSVSSSGFCSWPRCLQHSKIKHAALLSLVLLLAVRVWHETSTRGLRGHRHTEQNLRTKGTVLSVTRVKRLTLKVFVHWLNYFLLLLCNLMGHVPSCLLLALHAGRPPRSVSLQSLL